MAGKLLEARLLAQKECWVWLFLLSQQQRYRLTVLISEIRVSEAVICGHLGDQEVYQSQ